MNYVTPREFAALQTGHNWRHLQLTPRGPLGAGLEWPILDRRLQRAAAAGIEWLSTEILEAAPCEGHVTVGLYQMGARQIRAFDARLENVLKTVARCAVWGHWPHVLHHPADQLEQHHARETPWPLVIHFGLLYHLANPGNQLEQLARISRSVLLDTHTAKPNEPTTMNDEGLAGHWYAEQGETDALSGLQPRSFWLTPTTLFEKCHAVGFHVRPLFEQHEHPIGPRGLYYLEKTR